MHSYVKFFCKYHKAYLPSTWAIPAFTPQPQSIATHWLVSLDLPTEGWPGWVDLGGWVACRDKFSHPGNCSQIQSPIPVLTRPGVKQRRWRDHRCYLTNDIPLGVLKTARSEQYRAHWHKLAQHTVGQLWSKRHLTLPHLGWSLHRTLVQPAHTSPWTANVTSYYDSNAHDRRTRNSHEKLARNRTRFIWCEKLTREISCCKSVWLWHTYKFLARVNSHEFLVQVSHTCVMGLRH